MEKGKSFEKRVDPQEMSEDAYCLGDFILYQCLCKISINKI